MKNVNRLKFLKAYEVSNPLVHRSKSKVAMMNHVTINLVGQRSLIAEGVDTFVL